MRLTIESPMITSGASPEFLTLLNTPEAADGGPCGDLAEYKRQQDKTWHWEYPEPISGMKFQNMKPYKVIDNQVEYDRLQSWVDYLTPKCAAEHSSIAPTPTPQTKPSTPTAQPRRSSPPLID